jgi:hypothetical protein
MHVVSPIACSLPLGVLHPTGEAVGFAGNKCAGGYLPLFAHTRGASCTFHCLPAPVLEWILQWEAVCQIARSTFVGPLLTLE